MSESVGRRDRVGKVSSDDFGVKPLKTRKNRGFEPLDRVSIVSSLSESACVFAGPPSWLDAGKALHVQHAIRCLGGTVLEAKLLTSRFATDFDICLPPLAHSTGPRRKPDADFLFENDLTHDPRNNLFRRATNVLERNTS